MFVETIYLTQSSRRALLAISFVVFVVVAFGLGVGAFCGYIAFTGDRSLGVRAFFVFPAALAIAASAGLSAFVAVFTRALATRGGSLQVTPETLAIHHPGVLRRPLEVPREQVRAVWIEPKSADARPALLWRVMSILALGRMDDEDRSGPQRRPTLLLRSVGGTGNALAIQLDAPIELTDGRFGISSFVGGYRPGWKRRIGGIFAIVAEPDVARRAFESWGVLRGLSERALMRGFRRRASCVPFASPRSCSCSC
jgi:hypothetical protein